MTKPKLPSGGGSYVRKSNGDLERAKDEREKPADAKKPSKADKS